MGGGAVAQIEGQDGLLETATENIHEHMRRRRSIVKEWLDKYPHEWRGMRSALALELYGAGRTKDGQPLTTTDGSPRPSKTAMMAVKRDIDVIRVWSAAVEAHKADPTRPMPTLQEVEAAVINVPPEAVAAALERARRGEPLNVAAGESSSPVAAPGAIKRLEIALAWLSHTQDVTDLERTMLLELVQQAERTISALPKEGAG